MDLFEYQDGRLYCEQLPAADIAARYGTPAYVYSKATFLAHYDRFAEAFAPLNPLICYSIKCCQNIHICRLLNQRGSGFDVVSGGELFRALTAGADPARIVFAGVGKSDVEVREALKANIGLFNVESESEIEVLAHLAAGAGVVANAALRVNPDVDPKTHKYTTTGKKETKFGVDHDRAVETFRRFGNNASVRLRGIHLHIGSPVNDVTAYERSIRRGLELIDALKADGIVIDTFNIGGGYGAHYRDDEAPSAADYARTIVPLLAERGLRVILEPGRTIAANAGILLTRVVHIKQSGNKRFVIVDASMNELIRPALYGAYHFIWPTEAQACVPTGRGPDQPFDDLQPADVVGPVCESGDFLAQERPLPSVRRGDLIAVFSTGAYAMVMASQYNSRPRAPEILVDGTQTQLIRRRETYADLIAAENIEGG